MKNKAHYTDRVKQAINALSEESSCRSVCHEHYQDRPMPSTAELREIVELLREILFPGYYGNSPVRQASIKFYIGVNTEKVYEKAY